MAFPDLLLSSIEAGSFELTPPLFGYETNIIFPFDIVPLENATFVLHDEGDGTEIYDKRECICTFELSPQEMASLNNFVSTTRGKQVQLGLPTGSGFFPAGPDKGDSGTFTCSIDIVEHNGMKHEPFKYFGSKVRMRFNAYPSYTLPIEIPDGSMQIGSIKDLRFPNQMFTPNQMYNYYTSLTEDSSFKTIDRGYRGDTVTSEFVERCNSSKAAHLIKHIVGSIRLTKTSIIAQNNQYVFGIDHGDNQEFECYFILDRLSIKHNRCNEFDFNLKFLLEELVTSGDGDVLTLTEDVLKLPSDLQYFSSEV